MVAHDGKLNIKSEQTVKDGDTLNFIATPSKDGDHRITGLDGSGSGSNGDTDGGDSGNTPVAVEAAVKFDDNPIVEYDFDTGEYKVTGDKVTISYSDGRNTQIDYLNDPQHGQVSVFGSPEGLKYGEPATVTVEYTPNPVEGVVFNPDSLTATCEVTVQFDESELERYFNKNMNWEIKCFGLDMNEEVNKWAREHQTDNTGMASCHVPYSPNKQIWYHLQRVTAPISGPESAKQAIDNFYENEVANALKNTTDKEIYVRVDINEGQPDTMTMWVVWYQWN